MRVGPGAERAILEAFKPGTAPQDRYAVVGSTESEARNFVSSPDIRSNLGAGGAEAPLD